MFCDRIQRDLSDPTDPRIQLMDLGFINRDEERARGIDYNLTFRDVIDLGVPVDFSVNLTANRVLERSLTFTNPDGTVDFERYEGEWGFSEWRALGQVRLSWDRWTMNWQTRYLGAVSQDQTRSTSSLMHLPTLTPAWDHPMTSFAVTSPKLAATWSTTSRFSIVKTTGRWAWV